VTVSNVSWKHRLFDFGLGGGDLVVIGDQLSWAVILGQATKRIRWIPRQSEAMKDVKPR